jgi:enamine deaminase RidA (YjgF/YER057c/UK114 family)
MGEHGSEQESHAIITVTNAGAPFSEQLGALTECYAALREHLGNAMHPVFVRYFLSDAANQTSLLPDAECATSVVQQSPLDGTKIAMWVLMRRCDAPVKGADGLWSDREGDITHLRSASEVRDGVDSYTATRSMLSDYANTLRGRGLSLEGNCVRTWFFVRDVDVNYSGVVRGRNDLFELEGLTPKTHFIASTGIGGNSASREATAMLDTYAVAGLSTAVHYLYAPTHLNPTYEYGVAFERGVAIDFPTMRRVLISGTASINNCGQVVHCGDIRKQTERMLENIAALLAEAECDWSNVAHQIVYLRDIADYATVAATLQQRFPDMPRVIVLAPVCRPDWLIEMEVMALK